MPISFELRRLSATLVFDVLDEFAQLRGSRGPLPRPFEPIKFFAVAEGAGPNRKELKPPLEFVVKRNTTGYHSFHNIIKKPDGTLLQNALAAGTYDLRVEGRFYQTQKAAITLPRPADLALPINLQPAYSYPFPLDLKPTGGRGFALLRGSLHTADGKPIAGATVSVAGANSPYVTDESGQWVLVFPDSFFPGTQTTATVTVQVKPLTGPIVNVPNVDLSKGDERALAETAFRGWVIQRGLGVAGATVEVQGQPIPTRTLADGSWFYYFALGHNTVDLLDITARLPDGSTLMQNQRTMPGATVIVPPFQFP
jgi:hypothetical protein